jgi:hypothetical protein
MRLPPACKKLGRDRLRNKTESSDGCSLRVSHDPHPIPLKDRRSRADEEEARVLRAFALSPWVCLVIIFSTITKQLYAKYWTTLRDDGSGRAAFVACVGGASRYGARASDGLRVMCGIVDMMERTVTFASASLSSYFTTSECVMPPILPV